MAHSVEEVVKNLKEVNIPKPTTTIGRQAFADTIRLEKVTIPSSVVTMSSEVFYNAIKLSQLNFNAKNATVPPIWRYDDARGVGVFTGAGSGTTSFKVIFGSSVQVVPANLFNTDYENGYDYAHVTSVQFSSSVKTIDNQAFGFCNKLSDVYYTGSKGVWEDILIGSYNEKLTNATIHYNYGKQIIGDVTGDGEVAVNDVIYVLKYVVGNAELTEEQFAKADLSGDGKITIVDAIMIQKLILDMV